MGVELSAEEIDAYLENAPRCILCVSRPNRAPLPLPMWFGWVDGQIVMHTLLASKKVGYLRAQPEVSVLVESGEHYFTLKAVLAIGTCTVVDDPTEVRTWIERINESKPLYRKLRPEQWPPHLQRFYEQPRAALLVRPASITTWDFAKIRQ